MPRRKAVRSRVRARTRRVKKRVSRKNVNRAKIFGRSAKNVIQGSVMYEGVTLIAGRQTARLGSFQLPANMILTSLAAEVLTNGGQKDFLSAGVKIGVKRAGDAYLKPRLMGVTTANNGGMGT